MDLHNLILSAHNTADVVAGIMSRRSLMKSRKSLGPTVLPCGAPEVANCRPFRGSTFDNHAQQTIMKIIREPVAEITPVIPYPLSFLRRMPSSTESKAFAKSRKRTSV